MDNQTRTKRRIGIRQRRPQRPRNLLGIAEQEQGDRYLRDQLIDV
jgi:hypothetical protein